METKELNYHTVFDGYGMMVARKMTTYFGKNIKVLNKEQILPEKTDVDQIVGVKLKFQVYDNYFVTISILKDIEFEITSKLDTMLFLINCDLWRYRKAGEFSRDYSEDAVEERISILDDALKRLKAGKKIMVITD